MFDYPRVNSTLTDSVHTGCGVDAYSKMPMETTECSSSGTIDGRLLYKSSIGNLL